MMSVQTTSPSPVVTKKPACKGDGSSGCTKKPVTAPPKKKPTKAPSKKPVVTKKPACKGDGSSGCTKKPVTAKASRLD